MQQQSSIKAWLSAFRLRTLPLSLSSIFLGSFLAFHNQPFSWNVLILASLTTLFLQILSNLANDYGDTQNGADSSERIGPKRAVQSGAITKQAMFKAIVLFSAFSFISGVALLYFAFQNANLNDWLIFLALGILAILAAIKYTMGKNPYGYMGFGDVFVFLFFGLTGVLGTYYLHTLSFDWQILLPASTIGLLSVGVLNLNNMRDIESDRSTGKHTLVVKLGPQKARIYHISLLTFAMLCATTYNLLNLNSAFQWLFLITLPLAALNAKAVITTKNARELDPQLRKLALTTLLFALTFGIGLVL